MKEKYTKITIKILFCIPVLVSLFLVDQWILPQKEMNDEIIAYSKIFMSTGHNKYSTQSESRREFVGNKFYTEKGLEFSIHKSFIEEREVTIGRSYIFQSITSVKSTTKDYSDILMSSLHGVCMYFTVGVTITAIISILMLRFNEKLSENGFMNIILINSFLAFFALYFFAIYN
jgi:hypothetical protein